MKVEKKKSAIGRLVRSAATSAIVLAGWPGCAAAAPAPGDQNRDGKDTDYQTPGRYDDLFDAEEFPLLDNFPATADAPDDCRRAWGQDMSHQGVAGPIFLQELFDGRREEKFSSIYLRLAPASFQMQRVPLYDEGRDVRMLSCVVVTSWSLHAYNVAPAALLAKPLAESFWDTLSRQPYYTEHAGIVLKHRNQRVADIAPRLTIAWTLGPQPLSPGVLDDLRLRWKLGSWPLSVSLLGPAPNAHLPAGPEPFAVSLERIVLDLRSTGGRSTLQLFRPHLALPKRRCFFSWRTKEDAGRCGNLAPMDRLNEIFDRYYTSVDELSWFDSEDSTLQQMNHVERGRRLTQPRSFRFLKSAETKLEFCASRRCSYVCESLLSHSQWKKFVAELLR